MPTPAPGSRAAGDTPMSDDQAAWQVRAALQAGDWKVKTAASAMPAEQRSPARLDRYWLGRAQMAWAAGRLAASSGAHRRAVPLYGILADEELGRTLRLPKKGRAIGPDEANRPARTPGIQRALALFPVSRCAPKAPASGTGRYVTGTTTIGAAQIAQQLGI